MTTRTRISLLVLFVALAIGLGLLLHGHSLAASARQDTAQATQTLDLPPIDSFAYLFVETLPDPTGVDTMTDASSLRGFAPRPVYPADYVLNVSVNKGCGNGYYTGENLITTIHVPEPGTLVVWTSTDGAWWHQVIGPTWTTPYYPVSRYGRIQPQQGNELIYARLYSADGRMIEGLCHFTSIDYLSPPTPTPIGPPPPSDGSLQCSAVHPWEVSPGQSFSIRVRVTNAGGLPVDATTLYAGVNPSGYFGLESCDPPCFLRYPGTETALGAMRPGQPRYVDFSVRAPNVSGYFTYRFSLSSSGAPEQVCATTTLNVYGGGFLGTDLEAADSPSSVLESDPPLDTPLAIPLPAPDLEGRLGIPAPDSDSYTYPDEPLVIPSPNMGLDP